MCVINFPHFVLGDISILGYMSCMQPTEQRLDMPKITIMVEEMIRRLGHCCSSRAPAGSLVGSFLGPGKMGSPRKEQGSLLLVGTPGQFLEKSVVSAIH